MSNQRKTPRKTRSSNGERKALAVDDRITFLIHRISARVAMISNPYLRRYDVDAETSRILVVLFESDHMRVGDLVSRMALPQSTISHQLQRLEKRGLISRERDVNDNRSVTASLTKKGRQVAEACNALSIDVYNAMTDGLSGPELTLLRTQLRAIFGRIEGLPPVQAGNGSAKRSRQTR